MPQVRFLKRIIGLFVVTLCPLFAAADETLQRADVRFAKGDNEEIPDFQKHVVPLLGRLGCNGRSCHGSFQGRGNLRLSLFGYDFKMDHSALTADAFGSAGKRTDPATPSESIALLKPMLEMEHEGGRRFRRDSWEHHLLHRWIETGASDASDRQELSHLEISPTEVIFTEGNEPVQINVVAVWADKSREDVTPLCRFRTNDDSVAEIDAKGFVTAVGPGDTHVIAFYDNGVGPVPVLNPTDTRRPEIESNRNALDAHADNRPSGIDRFVQSKLDKLGIRPSGRCSDTEFLRRVSIDVTGTLPTPAEIREFCADRSDDKRERKIDELLERPAYAAWWTNKLCDFTGCNPRQQAELGQELSVQWYSWIYARLIENTPYNELVRRIVLAQGRHPGQSYDDYTSEFSTYFRDESPSDFTQRESMPHYWTRRSMREPEQAAQAFAHNFLGIRLQCAQCHKHPFAPWTQDDFKQFTRFFDNIQFGVRPQDQNRYSELAKKIGLNVRNKEEGASIRPEELRHARRGGTVPWRELYIDARDEPETLSLLRSERTELTGDQDPRLPIMNWMEKDTNPWFARAFVNRVWASYFQTGIIDPPDDLNPANPPSHPELLDWLADGFVSQGFDMKWLHRQITSSDTYQRSWKPNRTNADDRRNFSRAIPRRMPAEVVYDSVKQAVASEDKLDEVRSDLTRRAIGHLSMRLAGTYAMSVFGKPERVVNCDCERVNQPTLLQSVFMHNDPLIEQRLDSSGWIAEITQQQKHESEPDFGELTRTAWLRTLSRYPTEAESIRAAEHFAASDSVETGLRDLLWALINTKEFILIK